MDLIRNDCNNDDYAMNRLTTDQVYDKLYIKDYKIVLPKSWETLGSARILVYIRDDLKAVQLYPQDPSYDHIQNITLEIGFGKSKTHYCNMFYREWTSCRTGRRDMVSQVSELEALLDVWRNCTNDPNNKDFLALGDMNLCALKWDNQNYEYKDLN